MKQNQMEFLKNHDMILCPETNEKFDDQINKLIFEEERKYVPKFNENRHIQK